MKTLVTCSLLLALGILTSFGQTLRSPLETDSTFQKALEEINYPNIQPSVPRTVVVFVSFTLNQQGKLTHLSYFNEKEVANPFTAEVSRAFWYLPPQKSTYAGEYMLPIIFGQESTQDENRYSSAQAVVTAYTQLFEQTARSLHPRSLLKEVYIPAYH